MRGDSRGGFTVRSVGSPGGTPNDGDGGGLPERRQLGQHLRIRIGEAGRWQIVVARALIAESPVDQDEVRGVAKRRNLPCGGDADQELASAGKHLLGEQHGKRRADGAADHPELQSLPLEPHISV